MNASQILDDQVIYVKRGRQIGFGFEPLWNAYFDFYLDSKWFGQPLLELQDVTFHLYLRKNLNDQNKRWRMPTIRQMKKKFGISFDKIDAMMKRLDRAHLLKKVSGAKQESGMNTRNDYLLSDPIATMEEFIVVAQEGVFGCELIYACPDNQNTCSENRDTSVPEIGTQRESKIGTDQQTSFIKQTSENKVWISALEDLEVSLPANTFATFLQDTELQSIEDGVATISTPNAYARDWLLNRLSDRLRRLLKVERIECVVASDT